MKIKTYSKECILFAILCWLIPLNLSSQTQKGIRFIQVSNWHELLELAKQQNKYIFVDLYTTWCGPCKLMDKEVYSNEKIGVLFNEKYIAVKVQMDSTANDNEFVMAWYKEAKALGKRENVEAFPTLLFYSPNGQLIFKSVGYRSPTSINKLATYLSQPESNANFRRDLKAYQNGIRDYETLPALVTNIREFLGDYKLALTVASDYKNNYLDKLKASDFLKIENLNFINTNGDVKLVNSRDEFFKTAYRNPEFIDSNLQTGTALHYLNEVVFREELASALYRDGKPIIENPNWKYLDKTISYKYKKLDVAKLILRAKVEFYKQIVNWDLYTKFRTEELEKYPIKGDDFAIATGLNDPAWDIFEKSNDRNALKRALQWSIMSSKLILPETNLEFHDTQANLLYKLGRTKEAIALQEKTHAEVVKINKREGKNANFYSDIEINLEKMRKGLPTW